jgi:hypothetical protein
VSGVPMAADTARAFSGGTLSEREAQAERHLPIPGGRSSRDGASRSDGSGAGPPEQASSSGKPVAPRSESVSYRPEVPTHG